MPFLQGNPSPIDDKSGVIVNDLDDIPRCIFLDHKIAKEIAAFRLLIHLNSGVGNEREVVAFAGHRPRNELDPVVLGKALAHRRSMIIVLKSFQIRQRVVRENRREVLIAAKQDPLDIRQVLGIHVLQLAVILAAGAALSRQIVAQETGGQPGNLGQVLIPDIVLGDVRCERPGNPRAPRNPGAWNTTRGRGCESRAQ